MKKLRIFLILVLGLFLTLRGFSYFQTRYVLPFFGTVPGSITICSVSNTHSKRSIKAYFKVLATTGKYTPTVYPLGEIAPQKMAIFTLGVKSKKGKPGINAIGFAKPKGFQPWVLKVGMNAFSSGSFIFIGSKQEFTQNNPVDQYVALYCYSHDFLTRQKRYIPLYR